jgi:Fe2+ or Zn2+ uptake regulation protein
MDDVLQLIKSKGQRVTSQKKEVLCALQKKPLTVAEIFKSVNTKKMQVDKATIYRILTGFMKLGLIREIFLNGREARYELSNSEHHHHLVCEECGSIEDVALCEDLLLKEVRKQSSFKVKSHSLEFFGSCKNCQRD